MSARTELWPRAGLNNKTTKTPKMSSNDKDNWMSQFSGYQNTLYQNSQISFDIINKIVFFIEVYLYIYKCIFCWKYLGQEKRDE